MVLYIYFLFDLFVALVGYLVAEHHSSYQGMTSTRYYCKQQSQSNKGKLTLNHGIGHIIKKVEQITYGGSGNTHTQFLSKGNTAVSQSRYPLPQFCMTIINRLGNGRPQYGGVQVYHKGQYKVQGKGPKQVAGSNQKQHSETQQSHGQLRPFVQLHLTVVLGN